MSKGHIVYRVILRPTQVTTMQNTIRTLVSVLLTASVTGCVAIPDHASGKQLINLVPSLIGKDSGALVESLDQPRDAVWVNDTKHVA